MSFGLTSLEARIAASIRRARYLWLGATVLLLWSMSRAVQVIARERGDASTPMIIAGAAGIAYSVMTWALFPRLLARSRVSVSSDRILVMRWVFAYIACMMGVVAVVAGGEEWLYWLGLAVSVALLVLTARGAGGKATPAA